MNIDGGRPFPMNNMSRLIIPAALGVLLAACQTERPTWFQERCERAGFVKGTQAYDECVARDLEWLRQQDERRNQPAGP